MSTEIDKTNSSSSGGDYVVCKGATCSCSAGSVPCVALKISQDKVFINDATGDKAVATVSDNVFQVSSQPFGTCSLNPDKKSGQPCMYQPGSEWTLQTDMSTHPEVQGKAVLTEKGELLCPVFSGKISIVTHGQQIVAGNTSPKADGALSSQISPLSSTEKLPKEDKRKTASVQNVYCKEVKQTAKAGNSHTETVCIEEELTFVAKDANNKEIDKNKFKVEEIYWALCRWTDKNKKEFVVEQLTQGNSFTHIFNKKGDYFVEGYGKRKSTGEEEVYSRKTKGNCFFEIRVRKNELKRVLLGKEVIFEMGKPVKKPLELIAHFDYKLSYEYLFNKKKSHIEAVVKEANSETPVSDGLVKIGNEGVYQLKVTEEGKEPFVVRIKTVTNKIVKLLPVGIEGGLNKVRPYSSVTFELFLEKKLEETKAEEQIYWTVTEGGFTKRTKGDTKYSEFFTKKGLYRIEATVEGSATRASYQLEVLDNGVQRLVVTDKKELYPTHKDIYIKAETVFDSLSNNEEIEWKVTPLGGLEGDVVVQHNYVNKNEIRISANVEGGYWISAKVVSKGLSLGKAPLSDIGNSVTIKVEKTHIEQWYFSDSKGNRRSTIGWWQPFWVRVSAPLLREQEATLHFWLDTQEKDKSHTARFKEICSQKVKFSPQGFLKEKIEKDFWQKIEKLPAFYECKGERRFFFTLSGISSVIDNYNKEIHQSSFKDINGHILIDAVRDVYMNVVAGVRLLGYFTQDKLVEKLTHVVRYGEQVKMVLYVMYPQGYDINKRSKSFYFKLFENKKGEDIKLISREGLTPNEEGRIEVALNTDYKGNNGGIRQADHPKDTPYLPRLFYCKFYNKKEDWEQDKNEIFTYPDAYGTAGDNDAYLDVQLDEKTTEQEAKEKVEGLKAKRFNYFEQLKIAKDPVVDKSLSGAGVKIGVKPEEEKKEEEDKKMIIFPLLVKPNNDIEKLHCKYYWGAPQKSNQAAFNSNRSNGKRKHAGRDLYTDPFTTIVAICDGVVLEITNNFVDGTGAITILHEVKDGRRFIVRYGEVENSHILVKKGQSVEQGQELAKTGWLRTLYKKVVPGYDIYMLHFELYTGKIDIDLSTPLSNSTPPFRRREDLIDPLEILKEGYKNTFGEEGQEKLFTIKDAREAIKELYNRYKNKVWYWKWEGSEKEIQVTGEDLVTIVEKIYRLETSHFTSRQYKYCGTGGMEVFGNAPYYGWDSSLFDEKPIGTWSAFEGKGLSEKGGNIQVTNKKKEFIRLPSVLAGMEYKAKYIIKYNGNYERWYNARDNNAQKMYRESLKGIKEKFVEEIKE